MPPIRFERSTRAACRHVLVHNALEAGGSPANHCCHCCAGQRGLKAPHGYPAPRPGRAWFGARPGWPPRPTRSRPCPALSAPRHRRPESAPTGHQNGPAGSIECQGGARWQGEQPGRSAADGVSLPRDTTALAQPAAQATAEAKRRSRSEQRQGTRDGRGRGLDARENKGGCEWLRNPDLVLDKNRGSSALKQGAG